MTQPRSFECIKCIMDYSLFYSRILDLGGDDVKTVLRYIVDNLFDKELSEIMFGVSKLITMLAGHNRVKLVKDDAFRKSMILYEKAYATLDLIKKIGVENILPRLLLLSIASDDFRTIFDDPYWDPVKQAKLLVNPPSPSFEQTRILDHIPYNLRIGIIVGNINSILIDRLLVEELVKRGARVNIYARRNDILMLSSCNDLESVFGDLSSNVKIIPIPDKPLFSSSMVHKIMFLFEENDLILVKSFLDIESLIDNICVINRSILSKILVMVKNDCDHLRALMSSDQKYLACFGDQIAEAHCIKKLFSR